MKERSCESDGKCFASWSVSTKAQATCEAALPAVTGHPFCQTRQPILRARTCDSVGDGTK